MTLQHLNPLPDEAHRPPARAAAAAPLVATLLLGLGLVAGATACGMFDSRELPPPPEPHEVQGDASDPTPSDTRRAPDTSGRPNGTLPGGGSSGTDATASSPPVGSTSASAATCGGPPALLFDGAPGRLRDRCGPGGGGVLTCDGTHALACTPLSDETLNACGGTAVLHHTPGAPCGCGGRWLCNAEGTLTCHGASAPNACGACGALDAVPGHRCDEGQGEGTWVCAAGLLSCEPRDVNACGGAGRLLFGAEEAAPGEACEAPCGPGVLSCASTNTLVCTERVAHGAQLDLNACDGCTFLPQQPGTACGCFASGRWQCERDGGLVCVPVSGNQEVALPDACGNCTNSDLSPGSTCSDDVGGVDAGLWLCADGVFSCVPNAALTDLNRCGGQATLEGAPGEACGACGLGRWTCDSADAVVCVGDAVDACGGCDPRTWLSPGDPCADGECGLGVATCDGEILVCAVPTGSEPAAASPNACGGCGALPGPVGASCGDCASWQCVEALGTARCLRDDTLPGCDP